MSGLIERNEISQMNTLISAKDDEADDILLPLKLTDMQKK